MRKLFDTIPLKTILMATAAAILFFIAYFPVFRILVESWAASDNYSHAFLILPIILFMVWKKRDDLHFQEQSRQTMIGLTMVVVSILFYLIALLFQMRTIIALSMCMTIAGAVIYLSGTDALRKLTTPMLLLVMLIPVPDKLYIQITFPLQLRVSQISEFLVGMLAVPILREGNVMNIPGKSFAVVEACSGMRSIIALLTLSVIFSYYFLNRKYTKLLLAISSVPIAILVNIIRVTIMILLFHFYKIDLSEGALHTLTGMSVFIIAAILLFIMERALEWWEAKST